MNSVRGKTSDDELAAAAGASSEPSSDTFDALLQAAVSPAQDSYAPDSQTGYFGRLPLGATVSERFVVEWFAGAGGMGDVYRCRDLQGPQSVALKVIRKLGDQARFRREVSILSSLSHEAIVRYIGHGHTETGTPYLAMEWLEGEDLGRRIRRNRLSVADCLTLARRICGALRLAHAHGFIHRDLKPSNVFLSGARVADAKLLDFGVAHHGATAQTATRAGTLLGTVGYMAPEQAAGARLPDPRDDLFSLGCVLFECLTGRAAFVGVSSVAVLEAVLHDQPPNIRDLQPDVPPELASLVHDLLCKDRLGRPASAALVLSALDVVGLTHKKASPLERGGATPPRRVPLPPRVAYVRARPEALATPAVDALVERFGATRVSVEQASLFALELAHEDPLVDLANRATRFAQALHETCAELQLTVSLLQPPEAAGDSGASLVLDPLTVGLSHLCSVVERACAPPEDLRQRPVFLGRELELATLSAVFDECERDEVVRTVLVSAPAGFGKSALASEFLARIGARARTLTVRATPETTQLWSLPHELGASAPALSLPEHVRSLQALLDRDPPTTPIVLCLEDAHWADLASLQLLGETLSSSADRPLLVIGLARPSLSAEQREVWSKTGAHHLQLRPLSQRVGERFFDVPLESPNQAAEEAKTLVVLAAGNARLLCALQRLTASGSSSSFEAAVALVQEQLRELPASELDTLCAASVIPGSCCPSGMAAAAQTSASVERELAALSRRGLMVQQPGLQPLDDEPNYTFRHPLLREAASRFLGELRAGASERADQWRSGRSLGHPATKPLRD